MKKECRNGCFSGTVSADIGCPECNAKHYRSAALIEASLDLLHFAKDVRDYLDDPNMPVAELKRRAKAVIRKAKGDKI